MPELFTSLLIEEVGSWVRTVSSPYRDSNFCDADFDKDHDQHRAVSKYVHCEHSILDMIFLKGLGKRLQMWRW